MGDNGWQKAKSVFLAAIEQQEGVRKQFIIDRCDGDGALIEEVESLLVSHYECVDFIEEPAFSFSSFVTNASALAGKRFGHYEIVREIGHGGMGAVFLAERSDGEFKQRVALKLMRPGLDTAEVRRRFLHERQILAGLEHPYIARLIDGGTTDDGIPFIVMEYVDGTPITEYAARLTVNERLRLFQKVSDAVAYAHRSLVIHRDLKPSNILVTSDGSPKLLDFGIAKLLDTNASQTVTNVGAFTPDYASPEQLDGRPITTAADVYSLGVLLYELLTGTSPYRFQTRSPEEVLRVIRDEPPIRSGKLAGDLENIVHHALRKEPERRYSSVEQFSADIERYLGNLPVIAREDTVGYRVSRFVQRHRYGVAAITFIGLVLVLGVVATAWQARVARQQRDAAQAERAKAERINEFLQRMLSYSNQSWSSSAGAGKGLDVTINEMLDDIAPRVETELAGQPDVRAQILRTIGGAYNSQARYELAEKYLRMALQTQREIYGDEHPEVLETLGVLGESLFQTAKYDEAEALYDDLVAVIRKQQRAEPVASTVRSLARALHGLGTLRFFKGDPESAIRLSREALSTALTLDLDGKERGLLAEIQLNLGAFLMAQGDLDESEKLLRRSLDTFRALPGSPRWEMGVSMTKLGECLVYKGRFEEGTALLREGERIYRSTLGDSNAYLARNLNYQSLAALQQKDFRRSEETARRALGMLEPASLTSSSVHARILLTLGEALCNTHRAGPGRAALQQSFEIYRQNYPEDHKDVIAAGSALTECLGSRRE